MMMHFLSEIQNFRSRLLLRNGRWKHLLFLKWVLTAAVPTPTPDSAGCWSHGGGLVAAALRHRESQGLLVLLLLAVGVPEVGAQSDPARAPLLAVLEGGVLDPVFI